jgi:hypothetical protein
MCTIERLAYVIVIVLAFTCGLLAVWIVPSNGTQCDALLGKNPFFITIVVGFCILAPGATAYIMAYSVRCAPRWLLIFVKLFYITLPAVGAAVMLSVVLSWLGLVGLTHSSAFLSLISASDISAGLAGIAAMKSIPEYRDIFPRWKRPTIGSQGR